MTRTVPLSFAVLITTCVAMAACVHPASVGGESAATATSLSEWPAGASPQEIGQRVAENIAARKLEFEANPTRKSVIYPEVVSWYGALRVASLTHDSSLQSRLIHRADTLRTAAGGQHVSRQPHVDYSVFGAVPLEIYLQTRDTSYLSFGRGFADRQWENARPDGMTREARYWVDDMYMLPLVQLQAYRATGDRAYLDRTAFAMAAYLDSLQQPNGLFYHAPDTPFYWGRGNGWVAAGMAELLRSMPADHPRRARIMAGYTRMMSALLRYQTPQGLWRQLIDKPDAWVESSGSGMFAFALVAGVREGWLDSATYTPAARRAWLGLVRALDDDANIRDVCIGTNKAAQVVGSDLEKQYQFYLARERRTGDLHGQAPVLWTAMALLMPRGQSVSVRATP